jgi:hypothetical protein
MSSEQLCITFAEGVYAHTYNYNCNYLVIDKCSSYCCGETFNEHPMTELYYYI